jgi:predicted MFS family arabinose efflux permease
MPALAPNIAVLDIARIIQGCSGPVVPICLLMLRSTVTEPGRYGTLMGLIAAVNGGVAGVDTLLGGYLATHVGFRGVFWTMAVVAVIATVFVLRWAPESRPSEGTRMDWLGGSRRWCSRWPACCSR